MNKEEIVIEKIENLILSVNNLKELMLSRYRNVYNINQKKGNLREIFTVDINSKLRLRMKPIGNYPYNEIEIEEIEFVEIDDKHYGEG